MNTHVYVFEQALHAIKKGKGGKNKRSGHYRRNQVK